MLFQQNHDGSEIDEALKARNQLFVTSGNPSELLDLLKETLHHMTFLITPIITIPRMERIGFRRYAVGRMLAFDMGPDVQSTIGLISQYYAAADIDPRQQFDSNTAIRYVSACKKQFYRIA